MKKINKDYAQLANDNSIIKAAISLKDRDANVYLAADSREAKQLIAKILPKGAEVMNMTSETLRSLKVDKQIEESGKYKSIRKKFTSLDPKKDKLEMTRLGAAHEWVIGSVHALSEDGGLLIASATGSQLPAYSYGAQNVLWVIGSQKIVKTLQDGIDRIYEYCLPLENERALKAYGIGSAVNKILVINKESVSQRLNIIIVKEKLGF